jgi:serine/threonine-protein kinase RsbW
LAARNADADALLELCLPALDAVTPEILSRVEVALVGTRARSAQENLWIVVAEALNNIAEHAYPANGLGAVALRLELTGSVLRVTLVDWGVALPFGRVLAGAVPDPADLNEGGYGWLLIRALVRDIGYVREGGQNRLQMILDI